MRPGDVGQELSGTGENGGAGGHSGAGARWAGAGLSGAGASWGANAR